MHSKTIPSLFLFLALTCALTAHAAEPTATGRLRAFLEEVKTLRADFTQTILDAQLATAEESRGTLVMRRPGKFRWDYREPFEQLIVADGKNLWLFDKELEQVTVKPQSASLASSPAMLLSGEGRLDEHFSITELGRQGELLWVELKPKVRDSDFIAVRIGFAGSDVAVMELSDTLGQTTRIRFENLQRNPAVPASTFVFMPPDGVDVIGEPVR